jgi:hypothetical protein
VAREAEKVAAKIHGTFFCRPDGHPELNGVEEKRRRPRPSTKGQRAATAGRRLQETVTSYTVIDQAICVVIEVSSMPSCPGRGTVRGRQALTAVHEVVSQRRMQCVPDCRRRVRLANVEAPRSVPGTPDT